MVFFYSSPNGLRQEEGWRDRKKEGGKSEAGREEEGRGRRKEKSKPVATSLFSRH